MIISNKNTILTTCQYLITTQSGTLPIDPFKTIINNKWTLCKYTDLAKINKISVDSVIRTLRTDEAASFCNKDNISLFENDKIIVYNDLHTPQDIRVALAHEIGHILRKHFTLPNITQLNFTTNSISNRDISPPIETDADVFSSNFLAPAPLFEIYNMDINDTQRIFCISKKAAEYRLDYVKEDLLKIDPYIKQLIRNRFANALRPIIFKKYH